MNPLATLVNPFEGTVVQDAWSAPAVDVASIHQDAFEQCLLALASVSRDRPDSVLIFGPAGSGKTHLLSRLQQHLVATSSAAADGVLRCVFVSARLQTNAQLLWQLVRRRLATDLLRKQQGLTQLQRLVAHQLAAVRGEPPKRWVQALRILASTDGEFISEHLEQVAQRLDLGRDLFVALGHLIHNRFLTDAAAWLRGDSLPEAALDRLGLGREEQEDREEAARQIVPALCRLAGETLPIVFCFDQIEALQSHPDDRDSLFRFGRMAADLADADANVLLISCIQSALRDLLDVSVRASDRDRIFKRRAFLEPLTREQVDALILSRLDSVPELKALRARSPGARYYPFNERFVAELASNGPCLPRRVIAAAAAAFEAKKHGSAPSRVDVETFLESSFGERRAEALEQGTPAESRDTLMHGLPLLWAVRGAGRATAGGGRAQGIDLLLPSGKEPLGVTICNETNMTSFAASLRKLVQRPADEAPPPRRTVLLRDARLGVSPKAKRTQEYLAELEKRGVRLLQPSREALSALEALRSLLSDARAGDLAAGGEAVSETTVSGWLSRNLEDDLADLAEALEDTAPHEAPKEARLLRDLGEVMLRRCIASLDELAAELGRKPEEVRAVAEQHPSRFGVLQGPPVVLFAHVPADALVTG